MTTQLKAIPAAPAGQHDHTPLKLSAVEWCDTAEHLARSIRAALEATGDPAWLRRLLEAVTEHGAAVQNMYDVLLEIVNQ
jgi:ATP/maltotriose-dependent transcriptional regulator MalT